MSKEKIKVLADTLHYLATGIEEACFSSLLFCEEGAKTLASWLFLEDKSWVFREDHALNFRQERALVKEILKERSRRHEGKLSQPLLLSISSMNLIITQKKADDPTRDALGEDEIFDVLWQGECYEAHFVQNGRGHRERTYTGHYMANVLHRDFRTFFSRRSRRLHAVLERAGILDTRHGDGVGLSCKHLDEEEQRAREQLFADMENADSWISQVCTLQERLGVPLRAARDAQRAYRKSLLPFSLFQEEAVMGEAWAAKGQRDEP